MRKMNMSRNPAGRPRKRSSAPVSAWGRVEPVLVIVLALAAWEVFSYTPIAPSAIPPMSRILGALAQDLASPGTWVSIGLTVGPWGLGLLLACLIAVPVGIAVGLSRPLYRSTFVVFEFIRTVPLIATLPLLIFLLGIGPEFILVLVLLSAVWPILIQTLYGIQDVDPLAWDAARSYGLNRVETLWRVVLPAASPYLATGLRISAVLGLVVAVGGSLVAGGEGLGSLISTAAQNGEPARMWARIGLTATLGLLLTIGLEQVEKRALHWSRPQDAEGAQ